MKCVRSFLVLAATIPLPLAVADEPAAETPPNQTAEAAQKPLITISKETTFITEPLTADGRVDYLAALDQYMRSGVTVENNAAVLLIQAMGPDAVDQDVRDEFFQKLGTDVLPPQGNYFVAFAPFVQQRDPGSNEDDVHERLAQFTSQPWKRTADPTVFRWLERNEESLELVIEATRREKLYIPHVTPSGQEDLAPKIMSMTLYVIKDVRDLARALSVRAMLRLGEGDVQAARRDLMAIHRLANLISQSPFLISKLVGYALDSLACTGDVAVAQRGRMATAEAIKARKEIEALKSPPGIVEAIDIGERYSFLEVAQSVAYGGADRLNAFADPGPVQWLFAPGVVVNYDIAMRMGNEMFDRIVAAMRETDPIKRRQLGDAIEEDLRNLGNVGKPAAMALSVLTGRMRDQLGKMTGGVLLSLLLPAFNAAERAEVRAATQRDLVRVAFALAAYQAEHQRYPNSLADLAPDFISDLPLDRFAREDLRYQVNEENYLLYSVGINGLDDQGRTYESEPPGDDVVVRSSASN